MKGHPWTRRGKRDTNPLYLLPRQIDMALRAGLIRLEDEGKTWVRRPLTVGDDR